MVTELVGVGGVYHKLTCHDHRLGTRRRSFPSCQSHPVGEAWQNYFPLADNSPSASSSEKTPSECFDAGCGAYGVTGLKKCLHSLCQTRLTGSHCSSSE